MKSNIYLNILIAINLTALSFACQSTEDASNQQTETHESTEVSLPTTPLFAITGYEVEQESITLAALKKQYCEGKVNILKSSKEVADLFFECENTNVLESLDEFLPLASENILITDIENLRNQFKALAIDSISFFKNAEQYPLIYKSSESEKFDYEQQISKLMVTGVTAITRLTGAAAQQNGALFLTENIREYFQDADWVHVSNEVSYLENCQSFGEGLQFCSLKEFYEAFEDLNVNIIELSGNHNRDFGDQAFIDTYNFYQEKGIQTFGGGLNPEQANTPLILETKGGYKIAWIGFNERCPLRECSEQSGEPGANPYDSLKAAKVIQKMKEEMKVDFVIASVQFAEWDHYRPTPSQKNICQDLVDFGADFVYGSQAHQVQKVAFYKGKTIFYGFGNFLFDQMHSNGIRQGFFLENYIYKGKIIQSIPVFTFTQKSYRPGIATDEQEVAIKKEIFDTNELYGMKK